MVRKALSLLQDPEPLIALSEGQNKSVLTKDFHDGKGWNPVTSHTRRITPAPSASLQLQRRFSAQVADEGLGAVSNEASELAEPKSCSSTKRKQKY